MGAMTYLWVVFLGVLGEDQSKLGYEMTRRNFKCVVPWTYAPQSETNDATVKEYAGQALNASGLRQRDVSFKIERIEMNPNDHVRIKTLPANSPSFLVQSIAADGSAKLLQLGTDPSKPIPTLEYHLSQLERVP
jgi:hypothetical protein